jgi:hypothetical protein
MTDMIEEYLVVDGKLASRLRARALHHRSLLLRR